MSQTKAQLIDNLVQPITGALGSASAPTFSFTADPNTGIYSPGADQVAISTNGSGRLFVDASGRIGVGASSPSSYTFNQLVVGTSGDQGITVASGTTNTGSLAFADGTVGSSAYSGLVQYSHTDDFMRFFTAGSERMRLDSSGRLGIGTSSPAALLHLSSGANTTLRLTDTAGSYSDIIYNESGTVSQLILDADPTGSSVATGGTSILLKTDGSTAMTIDSSQRVGIGTSSPDVGLHYRGDIPKLRIESSNALDTVAGTEEIGRLEWEGFRNTNFNAAASIRARQDGTWSTTTAWLAPSALEFYTQNNTGVEVTAPRMLINSSGNVGIGTTSAGSYSTYGNKLVIYGTGTDGPGMTIATGTSDTGSIYFADGTTGNEIARGAVQYAHASDALLFQTAATERFRCDSSGRLLVGTSSDISGGETNAVVQAANSNGGVIVTGRTDTTVTSGEVIGGIDFSTQTGASSTWQRSARILCFADADQGNGDSPGRLTFSTTADGASSPTERMRIDSTGKVFAVGVYNATTGVAANVAVDSGGHLQRSTSSIKYKTDVETLEDAYADALLQCRPVWYRSTCSGDNPDWGWWGFIAEEVAAIDPRLVHWKTVEVNYDEKGAAVQTPCEPEPEGVQYERFVPHLLNLIKRQQQAIEDLQAKVAALESA